MATHHGHHRALSGVAALICRGQGPKSRMNVICKGLSRPLRRLSVAKSVRSSRGGQAVIALELLSNTAPTPPSPHPSCCRDGRRRRRGKVAVLWCAKSGAGQKKCGVEFVSEGIGKHDGSVGGKRYFQCKPVSVRTPTRAHTHPRARTQSHPPTAKYRSTRDHTRARTDTDSLTPNGARARTLTHTHTQTQTHTHTRARAPMNREKRQHASVARLAHVPTHLPADASSM